MIIQSGQIRTWLYTSQFRHKDAHDAVIGAMDRFKEKNKALGLSGFLITNGTSVMQLLEGADEDVEALKSTILKDDRHTNIVTEVWELETARAYPKWSMRAIKSEDYEALFSEIECARISTIATNIAQMLFDTTFDN